MLASSASRLSTGTSIGTWIGGSPGISLGISMKGGCGAPRLTVMVFFAPFGTRTVNSRYSVTFFAPGIGLSTARNV